MQDGVLRRGLEIDSSGPQYFVPQEKRINLEFSKNMMVGHLAPLSLYCWTIQSYDNLFKSPYRTFVFLLNLFKHEFLLVPEHSMHWYRFGRSRLKGLSDQEIQDLCHLTMSAIEGYLVGSSYIFNVGLHRPIAEKKLVQGMIRWGKEMVAVAQIRCPESVTSATLHGWLRTALEEDILSVADDGKSRKRRERMIEEGRNFQGVKEIVETLNVLLSLRP